MKHSFVAATGLGLSLVVMSALAVGQDAPKTAAPAGLGDLKSKVSYGMGLRMGKNFKAQAVDVDLDLIVFCSCPSSCLLF